MNVPVRMCLVLVRAVHDGDPVVLLGEKRRGFGRGRVVAPGGKVDAGETAAQAAARELHEETGLRTRIDDLVPVASLDFAFPHGSTPPLHADVFITRRVTGPPVACDEIDVDWVPEAHIPYDRMWDDAKFWLPRVLDGSSVTAHFTYGPDGTTVERVDGLDRTQPGSSPQQAGHPAR